MLVYARVENYRSIGEKQTLNFLASDDSTHENTLLSGKENEKILPVIPIYGGNATGKTNILKFLKTLADLVNGRMSLKKAYDPCKFYKKQPDIEFELIFLYEKIKYYYKIKYNKENIVEEALYYYLEGKLMKIFDIENKNTSFGEKFEEILKPYSDDNAKSISFLNMISKFLKGKVTEIDSAARFFENNLVFLGIDEISLNIEEAKKIFKESKENKIKTFIEYFCKHLNIGAKSVRYSREIDNILRKKLLENKELLSKIAMSKNKKNIKLNIKLEDFIAEFPNEDRLDLIYKVKNREIPIPLSEESKGIQKIFTLGTYISDILCNNKILIFDELETGFHPLLARKIIELFLDRDSNNSQLIFTTHNTNLLDLEIFRRDQIYFTSRNEETEYQSTFNSLGAIAGVRQSEDIEKAYLQGKYCDVPDYRKFKIKDLIGEIS
ncbi:ATP/GTP-binding protein [Fusobacterium nucleatum]|nr:ATP/GTP-binding protein [Fusobacterium nucleatum]BEP07326.1 ATP/GTP-binding protein [Fusobacterium nucleatum]